MQVISTDTRGASVLSGAGETWGDTVNTALVVLVVHIWAALNAKGVGVIESEQPEGINTYCTNSG